MSVQRLMTHPLTTRFRFKFRPLTTFLAIWFVFTAITLALVRWKWALASEAVLIGFFFYLNFFVLHKRPIAVTCANGHYINTNTPWICGFCEKKNESVDDFPFAHRCRHCSAEPKAYQCHHCSDMIFFTRDRLTHGHARCATVPVRDASKEKAQAHSDLRDRIDKARLEALLADERRNLQEKKQALKNSKAPTTEREREMKAMLENMRGKREKLTAIRKFSAEWRDEILADNSLSEKEKKIQMEEVERVSEEMLMTAL